jgi:hypothetical protein
MPNQEIMAVKVGEMTLIIITILSTFKNKSHDRWHNPNHKQPPNHKSRRTRRSGIRIRINKSTKHTSPKYHYHYQIRRRNNTNLTAPCHSPKYRYHYQTHSCNNTNPTALHYHPVPPWMQEGEFRQISQCKNSNNSHYQRSYRRQRSRLLQRNQQYPQPHLRLRIHLHGLLH